MIDAIEAQESLEAVLKEELIRMYEEVAEKPDGELHFYHGREAAERFGHDPEGLDRAPEGAVASFAGVGNPHLRSNVRPGDTDPSSRESYSTSTSPHRPLPITRLGVRSKVTSCWIRLSSSI